MSIRSNEREARRQRRIADAYHAAETGEGWVALARGWEMSTAGALMWCKNHLPEEVYVKIGQNGLRVRQPNKGRHYNSKPQMVLRPVSEPKRYETCQHFFYRDRQLQQCGAPTKHGKPICKACARLRESGPVGKRFNYAPGGYFA